MTQKISNSLFHSFYKVNEIHFHLSQLPFRLLRLQQRRDTETITQYKLNKLDQKSNHKHYNKKKTYHLQK